MCRHAFSQCGTQSLIHMQMCPKVHEPSKYFIFKNTVSCIQSFYFLYGKGTLRQQWCGMTQLVIFGNAIFYKKSSVEVVLWASFLSAKDYLTHLYVTITNNDMGSNICPVLLRYCLVLIYPHYISIRCGPSGQSGAEMIPLDTYFCYPAVPSVSGALVY